MIKRSLLSSPFQLINDPFVSFLFHSLISSKRQFEKRRNSVLSSIVNATLFFEYFIANTKRGVRRTIRESIGRIERNRFVKFSTIRIETEEPSVLYVYELVSKLVSNAKFRFWCHSANHANPRAPTDLSYRFLQKLERFDCTRSVLTV